MRKIPKSVLKSGIKLPELTDNSLACPFQEVDKNTDLPPLCLNPFIREDIKRHSRRKEIKFYENSPIYDEPNPHLYSAINIPPRDSSWYRRERVRRELQEVLARSASAEGIRRPRSLTPKARSLLRDNAEYDIDAARIRLTSAERGMDFLRNSIRTAKKDLNYAKEGIIALRKDVTKRIIPYDDDSPIYEEVHHCLRCFKSVYPLEKIEPDFGALYHRSCFRCKECDSQLSLKNFVRERDGVYCKTHAPKLDKVMLCKFTIKSSFPAFKPQWKEL